MYGNLLTHSISKLLKTAVFVTLFLLSFALVQAQSQDAAGVRISPALIEENVDAGVTKQYSVSVENLTNVETTYYLFARNIEGMDSGGIPVFADEGEVTGYELADWITLETNQITLSPGEKGEVPFTMNVPDTASPGSHFGGVFVSVNAPEIQRSGASVGYRVGNIISIRVNGEATIMASIRQFSTNKYLYGSSNVDFTLRAENSGNVLLRPSGPIEITNMLGQKVDTILMNENRGGVFPGSTREYTAEWRGQGTGFGRYEATVALSYGEQGIAKTMSSTVSFWILPMNIILPALGALAVLLLVTYLVVRMYINRALNQAGYSRSRVASRRRRKKTPTGLLLMVVILCVTALFMLALLVLFA